MNLPSAFEIFAIVGSGSYMIMLKSLKTLIVKFTRSAKFCDNLNREWNWKLEKSRILLY